MLSRYCGPMRTVRLKLRSPSSTVLATDPPIAAWITVLMSPVLSP